MRKKVKSFSLSKEVLDALSIEAKKQDRSESKVVDMALSKLFVKGNLGAAGDSESQLNLLEK